MTLPSDVSRCMGLRRTPTGQERCTRRAHCLRYTALLSRDAQPGAVVPVCDWVCTDESYSARIPVEPAPVAGGDAFCRGVEGRDACDTCAGRYVPDEGFPVPPRPQRSAQATWPPARRPRGGLERGLWRP